MKIVAEEKKIVMGLYCVALLTSMLTLVDNVPFIGVLDKVKYFYIIVAAFFYFYDGVVVWNRRFFLAIGLLIVHTVLYGLVFVNPVIAYETRLHFNMMIWCYLMVFFTVLYVYKKKCYTLFLEMSCLALTIFICWCAFTHLGDFVNPVYFINIFSRMGRYRAPFGMGDVNYCGNYCLYLIVVSVLLWNVWERENKGVDKKLRYALLFVNVVALYMLLSTASRSAILSIALFAGVGLVLRYKDILLKHWKVIVGAMAGIVLIFLVVLIPTGVLSEIWEQSNREGNMSINFPIFVAHGDYINGMGYMDNSGFLNQKFGYPTTAMDIYFLHILFSTGIVGAVLVFGQMLYLFYCLIRYSKTEGRDMALSMFLMMLFYAVWQVNYMNCRYWTGVVHMVVLFSFLLRIREEKDTYLICFKRR